MQDAIHFVVFRASHVEIAADRLSVTKGNWLGLQNRFADLFAFVHLVAIAESKNSGIRDDTDLAAAIQTAAGYLPPGFVPHLVLLTDGISSPGELEGMAQQMVASRMTVSTVAVGAEADTNLVETIARMGKGCYYFTDDPA